MARDELPKKSAKDDCPQRDQLPAWFAAVRQIGNPVIAAYLQAALLTGARREEVAGIRWEDVDFQWNTKIEGWILNEAGVEQPAEDGATGIRVVK